MITISGWSVRAPSNLTRFVLCLILSVALMILDHRGQHLQRMRDGLSVLIYPIQLVATLPMRTGAWVMEFIRGDVRMRVEYDRLRAERPLLLAKLQKYEALESENMHLRRLLDSAARVAERAVVAELVEVSQEPFTRRLVIAKGRADQLYVGQPLIDAYGIMGQVTEVDTLISKATLITDPGHAIPVQVNRNGLRAIVFGTGAQDSVAVRYLTASADIRVEDVLVSSGIGGIFPAGYPVARVTHIINDPNEAFLEITARPVARLGHNKEVLLIWPGSVARDDAASKRPAVATTPGRQPLPAKGAARATTVVPR